MLSLLERTGFECPLFGILLLLMHHLTLPLLHGLLVQAFALQLEGFGHRQWDLHVREDLSGCGRRGVYTSTRGPSFD